MKSVKFKVTKEQKEKLLNNILEENHEELTAFYKEVKGDLKATGQQILDEYQAIMLAITSFESLEEAVATIKLLDMHVQQCKRFTAVQYGMEVATQEEVDAAGGITGQTVAMLKLLSEEHKDD